MNSSLPQTQVQTLAQTQTNIPDLSIILPVFNAHDHLRALTAAILATPGVGVELIMVDDLSSDDSLVLMHELAGADTRIIVLTHDANQGAGVARNTALPHVRGRYVLFFDADDRLHTGMLAHAIAMLDAGGADLVMCPYDYERDAGARHTPMVLTDVQIWHDYLQGKTMATGRLADFPRLLAFTNYPWNKIMRTAHYRKVGLQFGGTRVHNDVLGHWYALLYARRIVLIDTVICSHIVHKTGANLTNARDRTRLAVFDALGQTYDLLDADPALRETYAPAFWEFADNVLRWAKGRVGAPLQGEFQSQMQALYARIDVADYMRMRKGPAPHLADTIKRALL
jgi:glycosyltransferase involved in cell wall biosynthesis